MLVSTTRNLHLESFCADGTLLTPTLPQICPGGFGKHFEDVGGEGSDAPPPFRERGNVGQQIGLYCLRQTGRNFCANNFISKRRFMVNDVDDDNVDDEDDNRYNRTKGREKCQLR